MTISRMKKNLERHLDLRNLTSLEGSALKKNSPGTSRIIITVVEYDNSGFLDVFSPLSFTSVAYRCLRQFGKNFYLSCAKRLALVLLRRGLRPSV